MSGLPDDARAEQLRTSVSTVTEAIIKSAEEEGNGYQASTTIKPEDVSSFIPKDTKSDFNVAALSEDAGSKLALIINGGMKEITDMAIGSGTNVDAVTRMKLTGDAIASFRMGLWVAKAALLNSATAVRLLAGAANSVKVFGNGIDATGLTTPFWDWIIAVPVKILDDMAEYASVLAFYFGVLLPSLPYTIFMITVVGWILAVFQSVIAAPLWAIMHMRPSQTFVGSDTQGYLLLLALFVRPALAIMGLFAAMLIADPVVDYIAKAFFAMRGDVVASTGLWGSVASFYTFFWWFSVFGTVLLPVLYMIYGLPQVLPDAVLRWLGSGLDDLGASNGTGWSQNQVGAAAAAGKLGSSGSSGASYGSQANEKLAGKIATNSRIKGKGKGEGEGGGGAGDKAVNANSQGVVDRGATEGTAPQSFAPKAVGYKGASNSGGFNRGGGTPPSGNAPAALPAPAATPPTGAAAGAGASGAGAASAAGAGAGAAAGSATAAGSGSAGASAAPAADTAMAQGSNAAGSATAGEAAGGSMAQSAAPAADADPDPARPV